MDRRAPPGATPESADAPSVVRWEAHGGAGAHGRRRGGSGGPGAGAGDHAPPDVLVRREMILRGAGRGGRYSAGLVSG